MMILIDFSYMQYDFFTRLVEELGKFSHKFGLELATNKDQIDITKLDISANTLVESCSDKHHQMRKKSV